MPEKRAMPSRFEIIGPPIEKRASDALHGLADRAAGLAQEAASEWQRRSQSGRNATLGVIQSIDFLKLEAVFWKLLKLDRAPILLFLAALATWLLRKFVVYRHAKILVQRYSHKD